MKKIYSKSLLLSFITLTFTITLNAQNNCVQCNGSSATGNNASAIGYNTVASGNNAFAGGYGSQATASNSLAFGYNSKATQSTNTALGNTAIASGSGSIAIGNYVKATAQNTFVFGTGSTASYPLTNSTANSIAFGVNSNKPTMLITKSLNNNYTGKVAIGQVTTPQAKLHIKSDGNEDAGVFLEPTNKNNWKAFIKLFDDDHSITVDKTASMELNSGDGPLNFQGESYCFGKTTDNKARIYTSGTPSLYYNARRDNGVELREGQSPSYAIDFNDNDIRFRTAIYQNTQNSGITNWKNALYITTDGKIGIGSKSTYLANNADQDLSIRSPHTLNLQSGNITLSGKIGINTVNTVSDYALAVDGGVITTKVYIKEVKQWPDYVFDDNYHLLSLDELKAYLRSNKHLPGVPSEQEIVKHGYDFSEMQSILLEKIEEMTRYILMLQDEVNSLKALNDTIVFNYDANGNRNSRSMLFKRIVNPGQDPASISKANYNLFPNPTSDQFTILLDESMPTTNMHAALFSPSGVLIETKEIHSNETVFDLTGHANGIFILEINGPDGVHTWKVIKQ